MLTTGSLPALTMTGPWYKSWAFVPKRGYILTPFGYGLYAPRTPHSMAPVFADFRN
jgi:hypothetical protein